MLATYLDPEAFEAEFRHALRATAASGRALAVDTKVPPPRAVVPRWVAKRAGHHRWQ